MDLIIGRFLTPLKLLEDDGKRQSRRDENSRGKVQNVRAGSSAAVQRRAAAATRPAHGNHR